jgi:dolichyl-phosphate beta-glucosyltransferase
VQLVSRDPNSLSVVIPAFNEERRLPGTLAQLAAHLCEQGWDWEIRVVDDGSTDGTSRVVEEMARADSRIVLQREPHRGKGGAVKAGLTAARGAFRFICDADLSMPVRELRRFLPPALTGCDVAIGSREGAGARRIGEPLLRHLMGRVFNHAIQWLVLDGIEDTQCGFKMFTAGAVEAVFPFVTLEGWAFDIEVLCIAREQGLRIVEVPIEWHHRGESRVSAIRDSAGMFRDLLRVRARARSGTLATATSARDRRGSGRRERQV